MINSFLDNSLELLTGKPMAHHSRCDILSEPVKIGPVTAMNRFFRSHIATECEEACLINLSYFLSERFASTNVVWTMFARFQNSN